MPPAAFDGPQLRKIVRQFETNGPPESVVPFGKGHINDSFLVSPRSGGASGRYVLQRINRTVFHRPADVMENISRVTAHLRAQLVREGATEIWRRCLTLVPARDGRVWVTDPRGDVWRLYEEISGADSLDSAGSPSRAREAARAFAEFSRRLADLPGPPLLETIPGFHDTPRRLDAFLAAVDGDPAGRARAASAEIPAFSCRANLATPLVEAAARGLIQRRVAHNDTKIENVLFDHGSQKAICVVDLDTVMPGFFLHDFGDLVRSAASPAREDDADPARAVVSEPVFSALLRGTLEGLGTPLAPVERDLLVTASMVLTFELGLRFLTDFLLGDVYFKTRRPRQNLDRARVHLALLRSIEGRREHLERTVETVSAGVLAGDLP